jgi:hypothetical protein
MIDVIAHAKAPFDEFGYPWTSPKFGVKPRGLRPFEQQRLEPTPMLGVQLGWATWRGPGAHACLAASSCRPLPAPHTAPINANATRYLNGQQTFLEQGQRPQTTTFQFLWTSGGPHGAPPDQSIGHSLCRSQ